MKISSNFATSQRLFGTVFVLFVVFSYATEVAAKRGCSAFGHSCFGGHGKRSDNSGRLEDISQDDVTSNLEGQGYETSRGGGEVIIADAGPIYQDRPMPRFQSPRLNLSPFIRQWLASYHRANSIDFEAK